jgi:Holliday junction resolvase RusA-like endonuclease
MIVIEHFGVPKGKGRPRFSRKTGSPYTPTTTRSYEAALCKAARAIMGKRALLEGPLHVRCIAAFPIMPSWTKKKKEAARVGDELPTKKPDADNILKMLDALNGVVWNDDCQIVKAEIEKFYSERPMFRIEVSQMRASI